MWKVTGGITQLLAVLVAGAAPSGCADAPTGPDHGAPGVADAASRATRVSASELGRMGEVVVVPFRLQATLVWNVDQSDEALATCPGTPGLALGTGEGTASHMGRFVVTKLDHCSVDLAPPVGLEDLLRDGEFALKAADGSTLWGAYSFLFLLPEDGGFFDMTVLGGTGRFEGAGGWLGYAFAPGPVVCDDPLCLVNAVWEPELGGQLTLPRP